MNKHYNIPWNVVRDVIHLGYDYVKGEAEQYDFISEIPIKDLRNLKIHAELQRHYNEEYNDGPGDWTDIVKLILLEITYREENDIN